MTWYNENDPKTAAWLRELIAQGHLPSGNVDTRSIADITPADCPATSHFFAGIGGWPLALRMAGWAGDVWTGSCPCQPFSSAGKRKGTDDERHLWPTWFRLIAECRPATIFGEQVSSRLGREWLAGVRADLETLGYAVGAADLCAASVGAPHIRQRLFWVAFADGWDTGPEGLQRGGERGLEQEDGEPVRVGDSECQGRGESQERDGETLQPGQSAQHGTDLDRSGWILCRDGKTRRTQPGVFPLAHGVPNRVVKLRGLGNAIVPQVAAVFVRCFMDAGVDAGEGE